MRSQDKKTKTTKNKRKRDPPGLPKNGPRAPKEYPKRHRERMQKTHVKNLHWQRLKRIRAHIRMHVSVHIPKMKENDRPNVPPDHPKTARARARARPPPALFSAGCSFRTIPNGKSTQLQDARGALRQPPAASVLFSGVFFQN